MEYNVRKSLLLLAVLIYVNVTAVSIVYNFRIGQVTKQPIAGASEYHRRIVALLFNQYQEKYQGGVAQNFAGCFGSYIYNRESYYARIDGAFSDIHQKTYHKTTFLGAQTDDILFTVGRNFTPSENIRTTISVLFGVPTHQIFTLQHVDFGYGQVGMGLQLDGSYALDHHSDFLYGARLIYFVPRTAKVCPDRDYLFSVGKLADILLAFKHNWTNHGFECGYTQRWDFGAHIFPSLDEIIQKTNYVRSNFYLIYKYNFMINDLKNRLLFNISYGFDQKSKQYGNKSIVTLWGAWNLSY